MFFFGWCSTAVSMTRKGPTRNSPAVCRRVHIRSVLDLHSFGSTLRQAPEFPLNVVLIDCDLAKCPMQFFSSLRGGRRTRPMRIPPVVRERRVSSLERGDRVLVSFFEPEIVALRK
jgi:hypothetical protein